MKDFNRKAPSDISGQLPLSASSVACHLCGCEAEIFFRAQGVPVFNNVLHETYESAVVAPQAQIQLSFCPSCHLIRNESFDSTSMSYSGVYENALHFSPRFQRYAAALARRLVARHCLASQDIIEIGCGDGDFLSKLCELGANRGVGFDPGHNPSRLRRPAVGQITVLPRAYSQEHCAVPADLICCRQVLEHIEKPADFLRQLRLIIGQRQPAVFLEVPNAFYTLRQGGIWDIIYEHCSYFTPRSLALVMGQANFGVDGTRATYRGQFIIADAKPADRAVENNVDDPTDTAALVADFGRLHREKTNFWRSLVASLTRQGRRLVLWGAGSKGVTFLTSLKLSTDDLPYVVDVNPRKENLFVPVTGQHVVAPRFLQNYKPTDVIIMNSLYQREIQERLGELDLSPVLHCA